MWESDLKRLSQVWKMTASQLQARRCEQTCFFRCFDHNEFFKEESGSPFCDAHLGVNEPWMLNGFPMTKLHLSCWKGRWRRVVKAPTLLKVAWSMSCLRRDGRTAHRDTHSRVTHELSTGRRKLCTHRFFLRTVYTYLLLTFDTCLSI